MSRLSQGDETAFWILWEQFRSYLHICCLHWLGTSRHEAEDALSQASIKALSSLLNNGHNITNLKGWLSRLTRNICVDIIRERKRHRKTLYRIGDLAEIGGWHHAYSPPMAEEALLQREMSTAVHRAVKVLPCRLQLPTMMRFYQELSYRDIARKLHITPANVRKRIQQARAVLQDQLDPYLRGIGDPFVALNEEDTQDENTCELPSEKSDVEDLESDTIKPCIAPYRLIRVKLRNGMEMQYYVPIKNMPKRIHQKIKTLKKYVKKHPRSWRKRLKLADFLFITGDWPEAVDSYRKVLEKQSSFLQVWLQLGNVLHLMGEDSDAVVVFERVRELSRNSASRHYVNGLLAICREQYSIANGHFKKAASLESDNSAHWHAQGATSFHRCQFGESLRAYDYSLKINPEDTVALINSHDALMASENVKEAHRCLEKALTIAPEDVFGLLRMAQFRINSGLVYKAHGTGTRQLLRKVLKIAPQSIDALASLAHFYRTRGEVAKGTSVFQNLIELHSTNPYIGFNFGLWLSFLYNCHHDYPAARFKGAISIKRNIDYPFPFEHVSFSKNNDIACASVKETINRSFRRWSIYATDGVSPALIP